MVPKKLMIKGISKSFEAGTIISAKTGLPVTFEALGKDLTSVRVIYVGEQHTDPAHHQLQLQIIEALFKSHPNLAVGMEMFDRTYQDILDQWSGGFLAQEDFLKKVHWYANWRYNFELYSKILGFIKVNKIRLVGLNIPPHIPPKIRIGGIENLSDTEKQHLPKDIDTTISAHRSYLKEAFKHHHGRVRENFEYFYLAQCVWEDIMAESVADHLKSDMMVVLAGKGHIVRKFGIPDRAFKRTKVPFRTIYLAPVGSTVEGDSGDYIWVTPQSKNRMR
ncbi:ChaN family lipoprotein [Thermodesulfobacteriota bacterium]